MVGEPETRKSHGFIVSRAAVITKIQEKTKDKQLRGQSTAKLICVANTFWIMMSANVRVHEVKGRPIAGLTRHGPFEDLGELGCFALPENADAENP